MKARAPLTTEQQCVAAKPTRNGEIVPAWLWLASALRELELILDAAEGRDVFGSFLTVGTRAVRGAFQLKGEPKDAPQLEEILCNARRIYWRPLLLSPVLLQWRKPAPARPREEVRRPVVRPRLSPTVTRHNARHRLVALPAQQVQAADRPAQCRLQRMRALKVLKRPAPRKKRVTPRALAAP